MGKVEYAVKNPEGDLLFYISFVDDISDLGAGFTFDSELDVWYADSVDHDSNTIIARTMDEVMSERLNDYFQTNDSHEYGCVS